MDGLLFPGQPDRTPTIQSRFPSLGCALVLVVLALGSKVASAQLPAELRGRITSGGTSAPVHDVRVEIVGLPYSASSDWNGLYAIRGLPAGRFRVHTAAIGFTPRDTVVVVANGSSTVVDVTLLPLPVLLDARVVSARSNGGTAPVAIFDRAAIERSGSRDVGELLSTVQGVVVTQSGGAGSPATISLRGSGAPQVLVLLDGVELNSQITGAADLSRVSAEQVETLAVYAGAQSAQFGSRALAGVIDIRSRAVRNDLNAVLRTGAYGERSAALTLGQTGQVRQRAGSASLIVETRSSRNDFDYDAPVLRGGGRATRFNTDFMSHDLAAHASYGELHFHASGESSKRGLAGSTIQPSRTARDEQTRTDFGAEHSLHSGSVEICTSAALTNEHLHVSDPAPPFGIAYDDVTGARALSAGTVASIGAEDRAASLGIQAKTLNVSATSLAANAPNFQRDLAAFGSLHRALAVSRDITLVADASVRADDNSLQHSTVLSHRVAFSAERARASIAISAASAFAPPSLSDLFFQEGVLTRANPALGPERTRNDIEMRATLGDVRAAGTDFSLSGNLFRADIDGMILWLPDFRFIWSPGNYQVTRRGFEIGGTAARSIWVVNANVSNTNVQYRDPVLAGQVAYRPRTTANLSTSLNAALARIELVTRYAGERRTVPGSSLNRLLAYNRSDVRVSRAFRVLRMALETQVGIDNVLDQEAALLPDFPFPARAWSVSTRLHYQR